MNVKERRTEEGRTTYKEKKEEVIDSEEYREGKPETRL